MTRTCLRIRTPSRLHFGLLGWGRTVRRQFGGVGLMIDSPGIELAAERTAEWSVLGLLPERTWRIIDRLRDRSSDSGMILSPACIRIERAPAEHVGLGVGTQLSLAVATAVLQLAGATDPTVTALAQLTGRGGRSGIGLHGFTQGGLIVDGGRQHMDDLPPLIARLPFPEDWSILVVQPPGAHGLHGTDESQAFADLPPVAPNVADSLCRIVLLDLLPAVVEHDLETFGAALAELQVRVGACFAPAQGGTYTTSQAASIVGELTHLGLTGAGQSSWGPTLYAFSAHAQDERDALANRIRDRFGLHGSSVFWTKAANEGARVISYDSAF